MLAGLDEMVRYSRSAPGLQTDRTRHSSPICSPPLLSTWLRGILTNGWASGSVLHSEITLRPKHCLPVEITMTGCFLLPVTQVLAQGTEFIRCGTWGSERRLDPQDCVLGLAMHSSPVTCTTHPGVSTSLRLRPNAPNSSSALDQPC